MVIVGNEIDNLQMKIEDGGVKGDTCFWFA